MKFYRLIFFPCFFLAATLCAQPVSKKLQRIFQKFENDSQLKNAIASLYVIDAKTGKVVFDKNSTIGLAPASTQKIITTAAAYELLGKNFRYTTGFGYVGSIENNTLNGSFYIKGSGDPTLGSWRWKSTSEDSVMNRLVNAIKKMNIGNYMSVIVDATGWEGETIPDGWIWQDIGNYYGAGANMLNWRENQYDMILHSGKNIGDPVTIVTTKPVLYSYGFTSYATAAEKGSGDNSYIYFPINSSQGVVRGTIPVNEDRFVVSGAMPSAQNQFLSTLIDSLSKKGINKKLQVLTINKYSSQKINPGQVTIFHTEQSPAFDSIIYWFLKKSINLYGEALVKTIANQKNKTATTDNGVQLVKDFWKEKGIAVTELNMIDGSGLSPQNRVTTHAQVSILQYAKKQPWFNGFYYALPEFNGMKMKSGSISDVKGFCGYQKAKDGHEYIFSFLVNNYNGSAATVVQKMYKVLDELK